MGKEKQIEEMVKPICMNCRYFMQCNDDTIYGGRPLSEILKEDCWTLKYAEELYKAGYRKQVEGEWILKDHNLVCSLCEGEILEKTEYSRGCYMGAETIFSKYCPNCGAKMRNGE